MVVEAKQNKKRNRRLNGREITHWGRWNDNISTHLLKLAEDDVVSFGFFVLVVIVEIRVKVIAVLVIDFLLHLCVCVYVCVRVSLKTFEISL